MVNLDKKQALLKQARNALKLSWGEKLSLFATRSIWGAIAATAASPFTWHAVKYWLPNAAVNLQNNTAPKRIPIKDGVELLQYHKKEIQPYNEGAAKAEQWLKNKNTTLLISTAITVGIGFIFTARSLSHYRKERKHLEKLYADKLDKAEGEYVPAPPTKEDLQKLHKWREKTREGMHKGDLKDTVDAAILTSIGY